ncbi:cytochrome P450 [Mycena olivaceomarginata]|nr:cytochrome P450 [Mycena olivaceomarginata]
MSSALRLGAANFGPIEASILVASGYIGYALFQRFRRPRSTRLKGPPATGRNFLFGVLPDILKAPYPGALYEGWAAQFGSVFSVPAPFGSKSLVLTDPKAIAHFAARETYERLIGRGLFWAEGDGHKRKRRALNPAFTATAIQNLAHIFFDSAYKTKAAWDVMLESGPSDGTVIEVQLWMNHISLDTIGLAGFGHDFGTLSGKESSIAAAFDTIATKASFWDTTFFMLLFALPIMSSVPTGRRVLLNQLTKTMFSLGDKFLETETTRDVATDKSVMGLLVKSASTEKISHEEVKAQINVLLLAGYETTAISLTWALIELSRHPEIQTRLREELLQSEGDLNWEDLTNHGSFLDAVTCEILCFHPPLGEIQRMAAEHDILPLSAPIETADGRLADSIFVAQGQLITLPIECINRSEVFWGPDAKIFNPARWLDETDGANKHCAQDIQGYQHLLTFSDGARICLGKVFAVSEFKAVLSMLVRNYTFELPKGPETVIGRDRNILPRPKVEGEAGYDVPLKVQHYVAPE